MLKAKIIGMPLSQKDYLFSCCIFVHKYKELIDEI